VTLQEEAKADMRGKIQSLMVNVIATNKRLDMHAAEAPKRVRDSQAHHMHQCLRSLGGQVTGRVYFIQLAIIDGIFLDIH
jgi:hypothetical protein